MKKKSTILLACLFFTITPFHIAAMNKRAQIKNPDALSVLTHAKMPNLSTTQSLAEILCQMISDYIYRSNKEKQLFLQQLRYAMNEYIEASAELIGILSENKALEDLTTKLAEYRQDLTQQEFNHLKTPTDIFIIMLYMTQTSQHIREALTLQDAQQNKPLVIKPIVFPPRKK